MARHGTLYYGTLHYGMSCRYDQVLDILRMSFVCDSLDAVLAVFESVASFGADFKIVRVQDTFHPASDPSPTGHRGLTVNVQLESAHVAECRIVLGSGAGIDVQRLPRRSVAVVAALPAIGNDDHGALLQILRSATGPVNVGDGAVLYGGFPETSFPAISNGQIASIDATSAELDREWLAGPVAACLTSHDCLLSSITLSGATGLEDARLGTILSETVLMQLGRSLRVLRVAGCGVSGAIPLGIWRLCKRLEVLDLANNRLGGPAFPHHGEIGCKSSLRVLRLSANRVLGGQLPAWLGHCHQLQQLHLSETNIVGGLPPQLGRLTRLRELRVADAGIEGKLPPSLGLLSALEVLDLAHNNLDGEIPAGQKALFATDNLLENTGGVPRHPTPPPPPHCSLWAAACCRPFMLTRAILMTSLFQRPSLGSWFVCETSG